MKLTDRPWLTCAATRVEPRLRLICIPYAGGSAAVYRNWSARLSCDIELYVVELPGHGVRISEQPMTRLDVLVSELKTAIQPLLDLPCAFFGHSLGAAIAFELTQSMTRDSGLRPIRLFLSGHQAPHLPPPIPPIHRLPDSEFLRNFVVLMELTKRYFQALNCSSFFCPC